MYQSSYNKMRQQQLMQQQENTLRAQQQYYQAAAMNMNNRNANSGNSYAYQPAPYVDPVYQQPMPHYGHCGHPGYIDPYTYQMMVMAAMANGLGCSSNIY